MSEWDDRIQVASFGGIEFEAVSVRDRLGRRVVEHEYLGKDGADLEDTGGVARPTSYTAVFHGDGYLTRLVEMQRLFVTGQTRALQHPFLGTWQAKAITMEITHESGKRDGCTVELEFKEDGTNTGIPAIEAIGAAEQQLTEAIDDLESSYEELDETVSEVDDLVTNAGTYAEDLDNSTDQREQRFSELDAYSKAAAKALNESDSSDLDTWPVLRDVRTVQFSARKMRESYDAFSPSVIEHEISISMPASALAAKLYGDASRDVDILKLNRIENPFMIPAGSVVKAHGS